MAYTSEIFWAKVQKGDGCWEWTAGRDKDGYGKLMFHRRHDRAHRVAWRLTHDDIPEGLFVLHRCDNPPCCNPAHLFLGTPRDNMLDMTAKGRAWEQAKTHCPKGHEYTPENTRVYRSRRGWKMRFCIECHRAVSRAAHHKYKGKRAARKAENAAARRARDPEAFKQRQREYSQAYRDRKRQAAMHSPASS